MFKILMFALVVIMLGAGISGVGLLRPSSVASAGLPAVNTMLKGTARSADGAAMEGVAVSARAVDGTFTTSVYTDEQGNYYFPPLGGGKYRVWAQAVGYEAGRSEVNLSPTREARQDLTLKTTKDFTKQLATFEYLAALPADTKENRRMKEIFNNTCTACHPGSFALQNRFDESGWNAIITRMKVIDYDGRPSGNPDPFIEHYQSELAAYLAKVRGSGPSPMNFKPSPRPTGDAARVVVTEYSVPTAEDPSGSIDQDGSDWSEGIPGVGNGARGLHDIAVDVNSNAWIADSETNRNRTYVKVDSETGKTTNYKIPAPDGYSAWTHGIKADDKGFVWLTLGRNVNGLGRIDIKTGKVDIFTPPPGFSKVAYTVDLDPSGHIWIGTLSGAMIFDPSTEKFIADFKAKTPGLWGYGVAGDANGNGWFASGFESLVGFADAETGKVTEIRLNRPRADMEALLTDEDRKFYEHVGSNASMGKLTALGPRRMGAGGKWGKYTWWPNYWDDSISKADIQTHEISFYPLPIADAHPYDTNVDKNGVVWTALFGDERVGKFDPESQQWTIYQLPSMGNELRYVTVDNHKNPPEVWVASWRTSKAIRLQFRTKEQLEALAAAAGSR